MFAQSIVQASGLTIPAIVAQMPTATRGELAALVIVGASGIAITLGLVTLFQKLFPSRQPPIDADLAKMASKEELKTVERRLDDKITKNDLAHVDIRDQMREEVRREIVSTAAAFTGLREETRRDLAEIRDQMASSCSEMRVELKATLAADEARSSNIHKRLDPLVQKLSFVLGKLNLNEPGA